MEEEARAQNGTPHNGNGVDEPKEHLDVLWKLNETCIKWIHNITKEQAILTDQLGEREQTVKKL